MALIEMSGIGITDIAGSIAGTTFQKNKGGLFAKVKRKPTNPKTGLQTEQRTFIAQLSQSWRNLTSSERLAWNQAAASGEWDFPNKLGRMTQPTGFQLYMELNANLKVIDFSTITNVPNKQAALSLSLLTLIVQQNPPDIIFRQDYVGSLSGDVAFACYATPGLSVGKARRQHFQFIGYSQDASPIVFLSAYSDVFGMQPQGAQVFAEVYQINGQTGQRQLIGKSTAIIS